jgi:spermidine synthase
VAHRIDTSHQTIYVTQSAGIRWMHAGTLRDNASALDLNEPLRHVFEYTALMMLALGYVEQPRSILIVGLGGGTMPRYLRHCHPAARIVNLEFDPQVVQVAQEHFQFVPDENMEVVEQEARSWLGSTDERFDFIFLDAFHGDYIPHHLTTTEFLALVRERLTPHGVVCANTWRSKGLAARESATYHAVFGPFHHYLAHKTGNRVIVASPGGLPSPRAMRKRMRAAQHALKPPHLDLVRLFRRHFGTPPDWPPKTPPLTDDAPP